MYVGIFFDSCFLFGFLALHFGLVPIFGRVVDVGHGRRFAYLILNGGKLLPPFHWILDQLTARVEFAISIDFAGVQLAMLATIRHDHFSLDRIITR